MGSGPLWMGVCMFMCQGRPFTEEGSSMILGFNHEMKTSVFRELLEDLKNHPRGSKGLF